MCIPEPSNGFAGHGSMSQNRSNEACSCLQIDNSTICRGELVMQSYNICHIIRCTLFGILGKFSEKMWINRVGFWKELLASWSLNTWWLGKGSSIKIRRSLVVLMSSRFACCPLLVMMNLNSKSCSRKSLIVAKINFASLKYSNTIFIHFCMGKSGHVCELKIMLTLIWTWCQFFI